MHPESVRSEALRLLAAGSSLSDVSRQVGVSRSTLRGWGREPPASRCCPRCQGAALESESYAALLGYYLGDGCISTQRTYFSLRIACDATYPGIIADVTSAIDGVRPRARVFHVGAPGVVVVHSNWKHWPCLFPQHGAGRKHERAILLAPWQRAIVAEHPAAFLRGLFHSDGCRVRNWTTRPVGGQLKRYDYPRWQFSNWSTHIRELCCWALDLVEIEWRASSKHHISVSTRAGVARLDDLIGLKS